MLDRPHCALWPKPISVVVFWLFAALLLSSPTLGQQAGRSSSTEQPIAFTVPSVADLKALTTRPGLVFVAGHTSVEDGGDGFFYWLAGDLTVANDATTIEPTFGPPGRY